MYFAFGNHSSSFSSMTTYIFLVWHTYFSFLICPITYGIVHTGVSIQNTKGHEVLSDSRKYFTLESHIHSFISMIPDVFLDWYLYLFSVNAYEVFTAVFINFFTSGSHTASFTSMINFVFLVWKIYFFFLIYTNNF